MDKQAVRPLLLILAVLGLLSCGRRSMPTPAHPSKCISTERTISLANERVSLAFDRTTGALVSLRNLATGDEYLKQPGGDGNPFRCYLDTTRLPEAVTRPAWAAVGGKLEDAMGGTLVEPRTCTLVDSAFKRVGRAGVLTLTLRHGKPDLELVLTVTLPDEGVTADWSLAVRNIGTAPHTVMAALPYLTGLCLGNDPKTNLGIRVFDRGLPGEPAWCDSGGVYGYNVSMQWQSVYDVAANEGLAFIVMDPELRNKIIRRFPGGGMSALCFDPQPLAPGQELRCPPVRVVVHTGNWRVAAHHYRTWVQGALKLRKTPAWMAEVDLRSSLWIAKPEAVAKAKATGHGAITSFTGVPSHYYLKNQLDNIEWAMYWDGIRAHPEIFGPYSQDGIYEPRTDLGGAKALKETTQELRRIGRHTILYLGARRIVLASDLWKTHDHRTWMRFRDAKGKLHGHPPPAVEACDGYVPWQDHLAAVCKRLLEQSGADGIRLDEFGRAFRPCFNPAHHHKSPYDGLQWTRQILRKVRAAMDEVNPDALLLTENFTDFYHESCDAALLMFYPGREIDAMRVAMPTYRALGYHPGAVETALNGEIANRTHARRGNFVWGGKTPGFPPKPEGYGDGAGPNLRWHELRATFREATWNGEVTDTDPVAPADPRWLGRLWKTRHYWLMVGGHEDASPLGGPTQVTLPELPQGVVQAWEFDAATLKRRDAQLRRDGNGIHVTVTSAFGAVLLPLPTCPPLVDVDGLPALKPGQEAAVRLSPFAPWRTEPIAASGTVSAPGLEVTPRKVALPGPVRIKVPNHVEPGHYPLRVAGDCLPLKRWLKVEP